MIIVRGSFPLVDVAPCPPLPFQVEEARRAVAASRATLAEQASAQFSWPLLLPDPPLAICPSGRGFSFKEVGQFVRGQTKALWFMDVKFRSQESGPPMKDVKWMYDALRGFLTQSFGQVCYWAPVENSNVKFLSMQALSFEEASWFQKAVKLIWARAPTIEGSVVSGTACITTIPPLPRAKVILSHAVFVE